METQRKVTTFVTRGSGAGAELLVFWHTGAGVQVPAGTVDDGETFDQAAAREVFEETALADLEMRARLGHRVYELRDWAVLRHDVYLRIRPESGAPAKRWQIPRASVGVLERRSGFARIVYAEEDLDSESGIVFARFEGWVPEQDLYSRQERAFYHFRAREDTPHKWQTIENGVHEFHLYWLPLAPKPVLVSSNQAWLDEFYDAILAGTQA